MENKRIETMELINGLTLELLDRSKKIAGDRWFVSFTARVELKITPEYFERGALSEDQDRALHALLGEKAAYTYKTERNFLSESEKETALKQMKERFLNTNLKYLSGPDFPNKLILKKIKEFGKKTLSDRPNHPNVNII